MLKKIKSFIEQYAIVSALIIYLVLDLFLLGLGRLLSLLPWSLGVGYLNEIILVTIPIAVVFLFGFSRAFKNGSVSRAVICCVPLVVMQIISFAVFLSENLGNPETNWLPWYLIIYEVFTLVCVGVREECIYRATIQNIVAKKICKFGEGYLDHRDYQLDYFRTDAYYKSILWNGSVGRFHTNGWRCLLGLSVRRSISEKRKPLGNHTHSRHKRHCSPCKLYVLNRRQRHSGHEQQVILFGIARRQSCLHWIRSLSASPL